jgi:hypothetical protein
MATTTGALAQDTLNIAVALQNNISNGQYVDVYACVSDLCAAVIALAEAYYATCSAAATPSLTTSVSTTVTIGAQYSYTQSTTSPVFTRIR